MISCFVFVFAHMRSSKGMQLFRVFSEELGVWSFNMMRNRCSFAVLCVTVAISAPGGLAASSGATGHRPE